jgi:hypothetical protein
VKRHAAAVEAVATSVLAASAAQSQPYQVLGPGGMPCGSWTDARSSGQTAVTGVMEAWVEGYVSAMNGIGATQGYGPGVGVSERDGLFHWLDNYCAAHPLDHLSIATIALLVELAKRGPSPAPR